MNDLREAKADGALRRNRRLWRIGCFLLPVLLFLALPALMSLRPIANGMLAAAFGSSPFTAEVRGARFGWFSATRLDALRMQRRGGGTRIEVQRFEAERSLLGFAFQYPDLGRMTIDRPHIEWVLSDGPLGPAPSAAGETPPGQAASQQPGPADPAGSEVDLAARVPSLDVTASGLRFTLKATPADEAVVQIPDVDLRMRVANGQDGPRLSVQPTTILDRQALTPQMCNRGLQLVVPVLAESVEVQGEVSLGFSRFEVPLRSGGVSQADIQGELRLHAVETAGKSPLVRSLLRTLSRVVGIPAPERLRIADDCRVAFRVLDGRVVHEGLAFGLPEASESLLIRTRGSVGFDKSLDLEVEVPLPADLLSDGPLARRIAERPLTLRVTGTLEEPLVGLPPERTWVEELAGRLLDKDAELAGPDGQLNPEAVESIVEMAGELLEQRIAQRQSGESGPLLDRIRERRAERLEAGGEPAGDSAEPARRRRLWFPRRRGDAPAATDPAIQPPAMPPAPQPGTQPPAAGGVEF